MRCFRVYVSTCPTIRDERKNDKTQFSIGVIVFVCVTFVNDAINGNAAGVLFYDVFIFHNRLSARFNPHIAAKG